MHRRRVRPLALLSALCLAAATARGEQLPLKVYTTAEGLPSDRIECILADSHGFLWFGTGDGLARFDGYGFRSFGPADGLPTGPIGALIESRDGAYGCQASPLLYCPDGTSTRGQMAVFIVKTFGLQ